MNLPFNGFESLFELMANFDIYTERYPDYENEWVGKLMKFYENNRKLSDKQIEILIRIAQSIGLHPGWNED